MNLQRREEIRVIAECPNDMHWAQEMRRAVAELLAHIDALEQAAAERVIDSGRLDAAEALARRLGEMVARMSHGIKPSSSERCAARWARSSATDRGSFERGWEAREAEGIELTSADGSRGPTPDYTGEGSAWATPVEARAVVVPEPGDRVGWVRMDRWKKERDRAVWVNLDEVLQAGSLRAIPADRVLGEGEERVRWIPVDEAIPQDRQNIGFIVSCERDDFLHGRVYGGNFNARYFENRFGGFQTHGFSCMASHWFPFPPLPDALRANQGGASA